MSDETTNSAPLAEEIPDGVVAEGMPTEGVLPYPTADELEGDGVNGPEPEDPADAEVDGETDEEAEEQEYIVPEADLDEIIDDMGHFQRFASTEKTSYPDKATALAKLVELHESFSVNDGFANVNLEDDETYFLVAKDYVMKLCDWLSSGEKDDTPDLTIDNSNLFTNGQETLIRKNSLTAFSQMISRAVWQQLVDWFGGGVSIRLKCIRGSITPAKLLRVVCGTDNAHFRRFYFNAHESVENTKDEICVAFGVEPDDARIHDFFRHKPYARIDKTEGMHLPLQKKQLLHNNLCYLEVKNERNKFSIKYKSKQGYVGVGGGYTTGYTGYSSYGYGGYGFSAKDSITGSRRAKGLVGLNNLGNTCYMNSILQCLSNTPLLKEPFLSKAYLPDINETNVLGYKGEVAKAYYNVMKLMWSGSGSVVRPAGFKKAINDAKTDFRGYQQHDSQEFLSQLLDAMHEDLNRVITKPITEKVETNNRPDADVAAESLATHKMRNDSIVTDLFTGLYKSTVTCPDETCGNVSVTFDPYMIIPLPLQAGEKAYQVLQVVFVPRGPEQKPFKTEIIAPKHGPFYLLREILKDKLGINEINAREIEELKQGRKLKVSDNPHLKTALGFSEDDEDVAGKRDIMIFQSIASRLSHSPLNNKTALSDLSKDVKLICFETFDYLSFEYFNFNPNTDWKRPLSYARSEEQMLGEVEEKEEDRENHTEEAEEVPEPEEHAETKSDGEEEKQPEPVQMDEQDPIDDGGPIVGYPQMESDDGHDDLEEERPRSIREVIEITEVPEEEKIEIGLPNCPFLLGDVWHGKYNHNTDQQELRVEIMGIERMDWSAYANYKAEIIEKYGEQNSDVQLDEKEFAGREVFFVHAQADSKEQLSQYMSSAFRGKSQSQFELKGVYITNADDEEEVFIPMAKPLGDGIDLDEGTVEEDKSVAKSELSEPKKLEVAKEIEPAKETSKKTEKTIKPTEGKKKTRGLFGMRRKKSKAKGVKQEKKAKPVKKVSEAEKTQEKKIITKKPSKKVSKTEQIVHNLNSIANKLIPGQMEKKYLHGTFVLRPTDKRDIVEEPTRYGGYSTTNYYSSSAYQTSSYTRQDTSRQPIILQGSVEKHFRYMWGKFQVDNSFTKGQFTCQRYESMNWDNHTLADPTRPEQVVKNWSKFPYPLNQDNRLLVLLCHKIEGGGYRTQHGGIPDAFFAPASVTESGLMDMLKARFRVYFELELQATGVKRFELDEETGEKVDLVERQLQALVVKRASKKFESTRYTSIYTRTTSSLVGQVLDPQEDREASQTHDPVLLLVCEWNEFPFVQARPSDVFYRASNETKMTLYKALDLFSQTDRLSAMNAWYCNKCKDHKEAYKQLQLWSVPKVLVIQFKRFSQEETRMRADKLEIPVEFPFDIDLSDYTLSSKVAGESVEADIDTTNKELENHYELVAVSSHMGGGLGSGHYVACARNENDGHWYDFNDSSVSRIPDENISRIVNPQAYVLFYVRKSELEARKVLLEQRKLEEVNNPTVVSEEDPDADAVPTAEVFDEDATEIAPAINVEADEELDPQEDAPNGADI